MEFAALPPTLSTLAADHRADAAALIGALPPNAITEASDVIRRQFSARMAFSTVFEGTRPDAASATDKADLKALRDVLPPGIVVRDANVRDLSSHEAPLLRIIRQFEGHAPAVLACLVPETDMAADDAVSEAAAAGFSVVGLGAKMGARLSADGAGHRTIGIWPPTKARILKPEAGLAEISGGASWSALSAAAEAAGLDVSSLVPDAFSAPIDALVAGVSEGVPVTRFSRPWSGTTTLPLISNGATQRVWAFKDARRAEDVLREVVRRFAPAYAETIPAMDGHVMMAAKMWRGHRRYKDIAAGGLRVVFNGPPIARRAAIAEAGWIIERRGGVAHHKTPMPFAQTLDAVAAAAGGARFTQDSATEGVERRTMPENSLVFPKIVAVGQKITQRSVSWYLRDLARSLDQANEALGIEKSEERPEWDGRRPTTNGSAASIYDG